MLKRPPIHYPQRPFHHFLEDAADIAPEAVAVRFESEILTYRELDGAANALAQALIELGVLPEDRVALLLGNGLELTIAMFAVSKAGAAAVMMNPRWRCSELQGGLGVTDPVAIIAERVIAPTEIEHQPAIRVCVQEDPRAGWHSFWQLLGAQRGQRPRLAVDDWSHLEAVLPFSSGTTGLPKAAVHTHASIVAGTLQWKAAGGMTEQDRLLLFLPAFHVYGVITLAASVASRATVRLMARFDAVAALDHIEQESITLTFGAAPVALAISEVPDLETRDLSSLRYISWGATPMDERLASDVTRRSGIRWLHAYGATEAPLLHCNPVNHPDQWRLDTPGLPVSDLEVKVVDLTTRQPVSDGATGEVVVRGPQLFRGYLPASANDQTFEDGWLCTGDIGWVESEGWIHLVDRAKEMIKVNAFQVAPAELEHLLLAHPSVADCGVFGIPDARTGEAPAAAVRLQPGHEDVDPEDLVSWVAERVAGYKRIRVVIVTDHIPRTSSGKILRRELRDDPRLRPSTSPQ